MGRDGGGGAHTASPDVISCFQTHSSAHHQPLSLPTCLIPSWKLEQKELTVGQEGKLFVWVPLHWMIADDRHMVLRYAQVTVLPIISAALVMVMEFDSKILSFLENWA